MLTDYGKVPIITFAELFDTASVTNDRKEGGKYETIGPEDLKQIDLGPGEHYNRHKITGFISISHDLPDGHYHSFYARPTERLIRMAWERTLAIKYDTIYFEAIHHVKDGSVALYARNNQIINSGPPIAMVPVAGWPKK